VMKHNLSRSAMACIVAAAYCVVLVFDKTNSTAHLCLINTSCALRSVLKSCLTAILRHMFVGVFYGTLWW
jgi:hypothetical protein